MELATGVFIGGMAFLIAGLLISSPKETEYNQAIELCEKDLPRNQQCEITAKVKKRGHKIMEVPITYNPRSFDEGKKIKMRDGIEAIWTPIKYRFFDWLTTNFIYLKYKI